VERTPSGYLLKRGPKGGYLASRDGVSWVPSVSVRQVLDLLGRTAEERALEKAALLMARRVLEAAPEGSPEELLESLLPEALEEALAGGYEASRKGEAIHAWVSDYLKGRDPPLPRERDLRRMALEFREWWEYQGGRVLFTEVSTYHPEEGYAGRADLVGVVNGRLAVVDLKLARRAPKEAFMQVGAYAHALRREGIEVEEAYVLSLGEELTPERVDLAPAIRSFLALKEVFLYLKGPVRERG